jgi:hypothetical protein
MNLNLFFSFSKILYLIFLKSHFCWPSFCSLFFLNCNFLDPVLLGLHFLPMSFLHLDFYTCFHCVSLLFFPNFPASDFALLSYHELLLLDFNIPTLQFIHCHPGFPLLWMFHLCPPTYHLWFVTFQSISIFIHCPNFLPFPSLPQSQNKKTKPNSNILHKFWSMGNLGS